MDPVERLLAAMDLAMLDELDYLRARVRVLRDRVEDLASALIVIEAERDELLGELEEARAAGPPAQEA